MDEAPAGGTARGLGNAKALNGVDCQAAQPEQQDRDYCTKVFVTLQAQLALRGFALYELGEGGYLISRWDRTAHLDDLRGVRTFLDRVGGTNAR